MQAPKARVLIIRPPLIHSLIYSFIHLFINCRRSTSPYMCSYVTHATRALQSYDVSGKGNNFGLHTVHTFWPHKGTEGLPGWGISSMPRPPSETTRTWKTIHTIHTLIYFRHLHHLHHHHNVLPKGMSFTANSAFSTLPSSQPSFSYLHTVHLS